MSLIGRSRFQSKTLESRHIRHMLRHISEYELIKSGSHSKYKTLDTFYKSQGICRQNFLKYYRRYINADRQIEELIPKRTGRKYMDFIQYSPDVIDKAKEIRLKGYNKYETSLLLRVKYNIELSPSSLYRLFCKLGINQLDPNITETKRRIVKMSSGELGHVDIHYIKTGTVKGLGKKKLYLLGIIDSYSRVCWLRVIDSIKSINVSFAALDILLQLRGRYGIEFKEMMSDNGSEFSSRNNPDHPFEKMLSFYEIKHRYTKPCSPKTNGKIERFWKTIETELLEGEEFESLEELEHHITGYCVYYNEHRIHQGINNKKPADMV